MEYTNSPLTTYNIPSPHRTCNRSHAIDTITIHCTAGIVTAKDLGRQFQEPSRKASSNYGIGWDGAIGMYVDEKDRSWCTSSSTNDNRAVTIEVASKSTHPYEVSPEAMHTLICLIVDICLRNNIEKLVWSENKNERINHLNGCNMTVHRDYANKACPGEYLYKKHQAIADTVNGMLQNIRTKGETHMARIKTLIGVPIAFRPEIDQLIQSGSLKGKTDGSGLDLTEDMIRCLVIMKRYVDTTLKK